MFARITLVAALLASTHAVAAPATRDAEQATCASAVCRAIEADRHRLEPVLERPGDFAGRLDRALGAEALADKAPESSTRTTAPTAR